VRRDATIVAACLGLALATDAHAATLTLDRDVVPAGGTMTFYVTTELAGWPDDPVGAEVASGLIFNGPSCSNGIRFVGQHGRDYELPLPNLPPPAPPWWGPSFDYPYGCQNLKPGSYLARLDYYRLTGSFPPSTTHFIEVPFSVLESLGVKANPAAIPAGGTTSIEASGVDPRDPATALQVECPDGTVDQAVDVTPIDAGYSMTWPGPYFAGACDSSQPGAYQVRLTTELRSTATYLRVFGDRDGDGWLDGYDNCPNDPNPGQEDVDGDNRGDECDDDNDNDAIADETDNCPDVANPPQVDLDVDGLGDACDPDIEDDGVLNASDNCDYLWNPGQEDVDGDTFGDPCDPDPEDSDNDGASDLVDNCPSAFNPAQQDDDGDGIGSACDPDIDGDGIRNADEGLAGTHPNDPQPLDIGINEFFDGAPIGSGGGVPDGEPVGVVVNPASDASSVDVTVTDPWGNPYAQETLIPQSPVVFWFVPIWPGEWRIDAELDNGESYSATLQVIPEPGAALGGAIALGSLLVAYRVTRR
jgi:hypothetical protein